MLDTLIDILSRTFDTLVNTIYIIILFCRKNISFIKFLKKKNLANYHKENILGHV